MEVALLIAAVILIIVIVINIFQQKSTLEEVIVKYSYLAKKQIMTNAEKVFYDKLLEAADDMYYVVPQAHLSMFIDHKVKGQSWKAAFSTINGKSVDFLIVEKATQKPVLAIELDDYTHTRPERIRRDAIVKEILERAGIPLQRYANNGQIPTFDAILTTKETPAL